MNDAQKVVKDDIVNVIKLGIAAAGYVTLSDYEVEQVLQHVYPKTATNQSGQPIGDFPDKIPTQAEFDKQHATPLEYGDEGDWLIVSKAVGQKQAFDMIVATMKEWGVDDEALPKDESDLGTYDIGWGYDHDSYHYSEGGYWICSDDNKVSKRYEAWGFATQ